jgi:hypothetical protein
MDLLWEAFENFKHNLFKPLLLFFYAGFTVPLLGVNFEFPYAIYQGLTIYLLIAIGWHGGEELANLSGGELSQALGFMLLGFVVNCCIGVLAYLMLRGMTKLRRVDAATVAGYYGSDSAGTFVTCVGVLAGLVQLKGPEYGYAPYMPVMLAVMEIPGCLVALYLIARLRRTGMDTAGNMPDEPGYDINKRELPVAGHAAHATGIHATGRHNSPPTHVANGGEENGAELEARISLEKREGQRAIAGHPATDRVFTKELLHEVFLNPGIFLLFAGIMIGFISKYQEKLYGTKITADNDRLFLNLFQGVLCLFLLEMGMTASRRLKDLRAAGWPFIAFGLLAPNIFASIGIISAHMYSMFLGEPFAIGTYALFAVLCGAASYIAVPAVQRIAIPEASPTLPLAASLGLTFSYNVTLGIPIYILITKTLITYWPVVATALAN